MTRFQYANRVLMSCKTVDQVLTVIMWVRKLRGICLSEKMCLYKRSEQQTEYIGKLKGLEMETKVEDLRKQENPTPKPLNALAASIHEANKAAGWWEADKIRRPAEIHMLIVTEIAEATEEIRKQTPPVYVHNNGICPIEHMGFESLTMIENGNTPEEKISYMKPEGELIELADAMIRILDYCGHKGWDLDGAIDLKRKYNATRSHRHGGKAL